jgi:hypothetical protein
MTTQTAPKKSPAKKIKLAVDWLADFRTQLGDTSKYSLDERYNIATALRTLAMEVYA